MRCGKGTTWEGGMRVPGFISYPGRIKPGISHALTSTLDIMPTIISIVRKSADKKSLPSDNIYEGKVGYDMSGVLLKEEKVRL